MNHNEGMTDHESSKIDLASDSLEVLQNAEQKALMNLVDRLRRLGLSSLLPLPQIVVCGDQSSGKSSVLEAITEIPFPRKENLCTRFATQITITRGEKRQILCSINPDSYRPETEQSILRQFSRTIEDFNELPSIIELATEVMGLSADKAFSRDVLNVEICGQDLPQLTLVDLPGLIHSASKVQSDEDVEMIKNLVNDYISESRTIILAVISAKNDYANQIILKRCREFDPNGARTLGIITKPDQLRPGTDNETAWLDLARNKDIYFELGWHILQNRKDDEHHLSFSERNTREISFLNSGSYKSLPGTMKGIASLRERLSTLLYNHIKKELPVLKLELEAMIQETDRDLIKLGKSRSTLLDQRVYLSEIVTGAWEVLRMGGNGDYDHSFFGPLNLDVPVTSGQNARRLRAVVQSLNMQFAESIRLHGHKHDVEEALLASPAGTEVYSSDSDHQSEARPPSIVLPKRIERKRAVKRIIKIMARSRGRELFGTFNPMLINELFREESARWEEIAQSHITTVAEACKLFVVDVLTFVSAKEVKSRLDMSVVQPSLKSSHEDALQELDRIIADKNRHAITYNHYFTDTICKKQQDRHSKVVLKSAKEATVSVSEKTWLSGPGYEAKDYISPALFKQTLSNAADPDMSKFSAEQVLDAHDAFYKDELKYFVGVVTKQIIERHLVAPLAQVLSPGLLVRLTDKQISDLVAEPVESANLREHLSARLRILQEGKTVFMATSDPYQ